MSTKDYIELVELTLWIISMTVLGYVHFKEKQQIYFIQLARQLMIVKAIGANRQACPILYSIRNLIFKEKYFLIREVNYINRKEKDSYFRRTTRPMGL
ncbi:hypothetical protein [Lactobacillus johnsonii]|uniref:hypothetical protein n=1 Tax=Lactobacillus johnsonii TaxID=33959 RepID=UPI0021A8EBCB|nr:hypothetical protein [Lactobacillus johnsonii]MCT3386069.1 hypothetical protein [Lactobacillus johnsonii]